MPIIAYLLITDFIIRPTATIDIIQIFTIKSDRNNIVKESVFCEVNSLDNWGCGIKCGCGWKCGNGIKCGWNCGNGRLITVANNVKKNVFTNIFCRTQYCIIIICCCNNIIFFFIFFKTKIFYKQKKNTFLKKLYLIFKNNSYFFKKTLFNF